MTVNVTSAKVIKILEFLLLVSILGLLIWSRPWDSGKSSETRTISVAGEATVKALPDEYILSPYFQKSSTDQKALQAELTEQANTAVDKLKELGVSEDDIDLDASSYDYWYVRDNEEGTLTVRLTITLNDKELAQKAQDYLLTLDNIEGQLTPRATFSENKSDELDEQATEEATNDARKKAEKQAELLGAEVGEVISVGDSGNSAYPTLYDSLPRGASLEATEDSAASLPILTGKDEYHKTVNVTFELK